MKRTVIGLLTLFLFGCSVQPAEQPVAEQSQDLNDLDSDGVINARDNCADTPLSSVVDNNGCPVHVNREEENGVQVLFANDSDITPDSFLPEIKRMSQFLNQYPDTFIELKGYASPVGRHDYNITLSQRRAKRVRNQLIADGIDPNRIQTVGFGDAEPIKADSKEATNTLSRRVVAKVVGSESNVVEEWTIFTVRDN
ncbi:OmpA family protein [Photobacterium sagamiensis]|uniref:OmpA family protein n=1 Tax=Photobacterium sagamiensis TaxID=2910241 RepID=UPI003D0AC977